jgi:lipoate-protein ligase A
MGGDMRLIRAAHRDDPLLDMAVTRALLERVAAGELGPAARVLRPGPTLAFGRLDARAPGFPRAAAAARAHGFEPVLRLGGGHAAGYDAGSVLVEVVTRQAAIADGIQERFRDGAALLASALGRLGVPAEIGELPGEYCAGAWSVHAGGVKLAGIAQRSIRGASLLTAHVVVEGGERLRAALVDVYDALGLVWDPRTAGGAADVVPGLTARAVEAVLADAVADRWGATEGTLDAGTLARARDLRDEHRVP